MAADHPADFPPRRRPGLDRHIADSLQLLPLIASGTDRGIDLGSGAGLPGLVLAIATGIPFDLIEADHARPPSCASRAPHRAPASIHATRIEAAAIPRAPLITARALAPLDTLLRWAAPLLAPAVSACSPRGAESKTN